MKRQSDLFDQIIDYSNIRIAFLKALRGNRKGLTVIDFCRRISKNLAAVGRKLQALDCGWGSYRSFMIQEPKVRVINTAPFEQRVMQHAIMNIVEPIFDRPMIDHSYACRKGKGTHSAVQYAFGRCKAVPFFLKLDIRKYFDSIHHETLKALIRRLIKDERVLFLLDGVIDSYETSPGRGVPIGNLTSQFFANLYLAGMDHFILEKLRPSAYCRYMDDFVIWSPSHSQLKEMFAQINEYVNRNLKLTVKQPVFGKTAAGLPFLGFLVKDKGIYLLRKSKRRFKKRITKITRALYSGAISEEKAAEKARSVCSAINIARTNRLRKKAIEDGERFLALTV